MLYTGNLFIILFFIYGISFFTMGIIALQQETNKETNFPLIRTINSLGFFGVIHGLVEWLIMFAIADLFPKEEKFFLPFAVVMNALSFTILLQFGIQLYDYKGKWNALLKWMPWMNFILWICFYLSTTLIRGELSPKVNIDFDTLCRYFIGLPASFLTAAALIYNANTLQRMKLIKAAVKFRLLALSFISYGIFAGILVNRRDFFPANLINKQAFMSLFGFPVEFGRMLSAVFITILFIGIIDIFRLENNLIMQSLMQERVASQERRRLGRELHDGIIQELFASGLQLEALQEENDTDRLHNELKYIKSNLNNGIQKIREFIEMVSTRSMDMNEFRIQLEEAMKNFQKISKAKIEVEYKIPGINLRYISSDKLTQIYYIIQEAISNAIKHSSASRIEVVISYDIRSIIVEVRDNGKGFDIRAPKAKGKYGITSMHERAAAIGGIIDISSNYVGTKITLIVPWEEGLNE